MGRKKQKQEEEGTVTTGGEQLVLIDVGPENLRRITPIARRYRAAMKRRVQALAEEVEAKVKILELVKEAKLSRLQDGSIKFKCDGMTITVMPRDEKITVKEEKDDGEGAED